MFLFGLDVKMQNGMTSVGSFPASGHFIHPTPWVIASCLKAIPEPTW
jgi:hypothetical protein